MEGFLSNVFVVILGEVVQKIGVTNLHDDWSCVHLKLPVVNKGSNVASPRTITIREDLNCVLRKPVKLIEFYAIEAHFWTFQPRVALSHHARFIFIFTALLIRVLQTKLMSDLQGEDCKLTA